jgi:hypothetical protein
MVSEFSSTGISNFGLRLTKTDWPTYSDPYRAPSMSEGATDSRQKYIQAVLIHD